MEWAVYSMSLSFRSRTTGRQQQSSHYHTDWPSWSPAYTVPCLITREEKLMFFLEAGSSSTRWIPYLIFSRIFSHSNVSPIPRYPFFILHTYLLQKYLPDFLWPMWPPPTSGLLVLSHFQTFILYAILSSLHHILSSTHTYQTSASCFTKAVLTRSMADFTLPNQMIMTLLLTF